MERRDKLLCSSHKFYDTKTSQSNNVIIQDNYVREKDQRSQENFDFCITSQLYQVLTNLLQQNNYAVGQPQVN